MTNTMSSPSVMTMPAGAILVLERPLQKFCSVDFIGPQFFVTPTLIVQLVIAVKS